VSTLLWQQCCRSHVATKFFDRSQLGGDRAELACYRSTPATARRLTICEIASTPARASCDAGSFVVACILLPNASQSVNPMTITHWPLSAEAPDDDLVKCETFRPMFFGHGLEFPRSGNHSLSRPALTNRHHSYGHGFTPCFALQSGRRNRLRPRFAFGNRNFSESRAKRPRGTECERTEMPSRSRVAFFRQRVSSAYQSVPGIRLE
jgi:hypothetical protein